VSPALLFNFNPGEGFSNGLPQPDVGSGIQTGPLRCPRNVQQYLTNDNYRVEQILPAFNVWRKNENAVKIFPAHSRFNLNNDNNRS